MGLQHHAEFQKKLKSQFQENFQRTDRPYLQEPPGHSRVSNKRINQLRDIAIDNKNKIQYNSTYHNSLT